MEQVASYWQSMAEAPQQWTARLASGRIAVIDYHHGELRVHVSSFKTADPYKAFGAGYRALGKDVAPSEDGVTIRDEMMRDATGGVLDWSRAADGQPEPKQKTTIEVTPKTAPALHVPNRDDDWADGGGGEVVG